MDTGNSMHVVEKMEMENVTNPTAHNQKKSQKLQKSQGLQHVEATLKSYNTCMF